jgi:hypothetical protein
LVVKKSDLVFLMNSVFLDPCDILLIKQCLNCVRGGGIISKIKMTLNIRVHTVIHHLATLFSSSPCRMS